MRSLGFSLAALLSVSLCACGDDDGMVVPPDAPPATPDGPRPECAGAEVVPLTGDTAVVISDLSIGKAMDGFDLNGDGTPDNKLAAAGNLAGGAIRDAIANFDIVLPIEFFDFPEVAADECVKFGIYVGAYRLDIDMDGQETANDRADCNDHEMLIHGGVAESCAVGSEVNCGDRKDNDCDGRADEIVVSTDGGVADEPSADTTDMDGDGVSLAAGDCDDTNMMVHPGLIETCGDGLDNDCDGHADFGVLTSGAPACTPFDDTPDHVSLDPLSFMDGMPAIAFKNGLTRMDGDKLVLDAGPSIFGVKVPIADGFPALDLRISGARILADVSAAGDGLSLTNGRLGGVLDAHTLDQIRGLDIEQIMLRPEDSLADAMFANVLGVLLGLPSNEMNCLQPDIDVDGDGLEAFCDSTDDDIKTIDICIDGDGTMIVDGQEGSVQCTEAMVDGKFRFVDGISVELNFAAVPVLLPTELP